MLETTIKGRSERQAGSKSNKTMIRAFAIIHRLAKLASFSMLLLGISSPCHALDSEKLMRQFTHSSWGGKEGIPGPVRAIAQTSDGYLWLGTDTGLFRFDGIRFVLWEPRSGEPLPGSAVESLCLAHDGSLLIGFRNGAISRLGRGQLKNFIPDPQSPRGKILSLAEDGRGVIWIAGQYAFGRIEMLPGAGQLEKVSVLFEGE